MFTRFSTAAGCTNASASLAVKPFTWKEIFVEQNLRPHFTALQTQQPGSTMFYFLAPLPATQSAATRPFSSGSIQSNWRTGLISTETY
jgi:hypothetical protein